MADAGVPYNVTQARAGHSTARMTMEVYSHRTTAADRVAAEALQAQLGEAFAAGSGTSLARSAASVKKGTEKEQLKWSVIAGDSSLHTAEVAGSSPAAPPLQRPRTAAPTEQVLVRRSGHWSRSSSSASRDMNSTREFGQLVRTVRVTRARRRAPLQSPLVGESPLPRRRVRRSPAHRDRAEGARSGPAPHD